MDATTLGAVLACVGVLSGSAVAYLGKRGENSNTRLNSTIDQIQEERDGLRAQLAKAQAELVALHTQRHVDLVQITRLEVRIVQLGGEL